MRYADDYRTMIQVVDGQMRTGILEALDEQIGIGDGTGENFTGLLATPGVRWVAFVTDTLTTLRRARTVLESAGERVTGVALHPNDIERLDLMREDGATGGFLVTDNGFYTRLFGHVGAGTAAPPVIGSQHVPEGSAILRDWSTTLLQIKESDHTLAATQGLDEAGQVMFSRNLMRLRAEGRYSFDALRPATLAVADLTAA